MAKGIRHLTLDASEMDLDTPYADGDFDAVLVKKFVEVEPGKDSVWKHGLGRKPNQITVVNSDTAINNPEVVARDADVAILRFVPDWITTYTSRKFNVVLRFA